MLQAAMVEELLEETMATEEEEVVMMIGAAATVEMTMTNSLNSLLVYWLGTCFPASQFSRSSPSEPSSQRSLSSSSRLFELDGGIVMNGFHAITETFLLWWK
jgi:hypothetical protein